MTDYPQSLSNEQLQSVLADIWNKSLPVLRQRVSVLEQAVQALRAGNLSDQLHDQAADEAHRMAGLLGTFGYPEGTDAARLLELVFDPDVAAGRAESPGDGQAPVEDAVVLLRKIVGV